MRYAFVDNATLQSFRRLEGITPVRNRHILKGDILALENFLEAILFYDGILYIEDPEFRSSGVRRNAYEYLSSVILDKDVIYELSDRTNELVDDLIPCIEGGVFTDEHSVDFFRLLHMDVRFFWEKKSGVFHLTPKIIQSGAAQPAQMLQSLAMFYGEQFDSSYRTLINKRRPMLYDSEGQIINSLYTVADRSGKDCKCKFSPQTEAFFNSFNYLSYRTVFYTLLAQQLRADTVLHPVRSLWQQQLFKHIYANGKYENLSWGEDAVFGRQHAIRSIREPLILKHELPMFCLWIAERMGSSGYLTTVYELRQTDEFIAARQYLSELRSIYKAGEEGFVQVANSVLEELDETMAIIRRKYQPQTKTGVPSSSRVNLSNLWIAEEGFPLNLQFDYNFHPPEYPARDLYWEDRFGAVVRPVGENLPKLEHLGEYYDLLTANVNFYDETHLQAFRLEDSDLCYPKSWWRVDM